MARGILSGFPIARAARHAARVAIRVYGPFGVGTLPLALGADIAQHAITAGYWIETADTALAKLRAWQVLLALGLLGLLTELTLITDWRWEWLLDWFAKALLKGLVLMMLAPLVVIVVAVVLVALARPWLRMSALRAARRALVTALITALIMVGVFWLSRAPQQVAALDELTNWITRTMFADPVRAIVGLGLLLVLAAALVWVITFVLSAVYLTQRNGLSHDRSLPLLAPLVQVPVAWLYLALSVSMQLDPSHFTGWRLALSRYGTPALITMLAIVEIIRLHRVAGIGLRDPLPRDAAPTGPLRLR